MNPPRTLSTSLVPLLCVLLVATALLAGCQPLQGTEQLPTSTEQFQPTTEPPQPPTSTSMATAQAGSTTTAITTATTTTTKPKPAPVEPAATTTSLIVTEITGATLFGESWVRYEETDPNLAWTGDWVTRSNTDASGGSYREASSKATCRISFQGTRIQLVMVFGPDAGIAKIALDNVDLTNYSFFFPQVFSMTAYAGPPLPFGTHTLLVEWTGKTDSPSGSSVIGLDAVEIKGILVK